MTELGFEPRVSAWVDTKATSLPAFTFLRTISRFHTVYSLTKKFQ